MTQPIPEHGATNDAMKSQCTFCQENLDAFGLGALPEQDASRISYHLMICERCQHVFASIRRVTNLLPFMADQVDPPPAAKARLFDRIANDTPETPALDEAPVMLFNPWVSSTPAPTPDEKSQTNQRLNPWSKWILPGLVAPLAICLIVLSAWANSLQNEVDDLRSLNTPRNTTAQSASAASHDMQLYEFKPACKKCQEQQASGQLGGNPNGSVGVVVAWNLDPSEKHQVWCVDSQGEKTMVTDLEVEYTGNVFQTVNFPQALGGYEQIYVARHDGSEEPDAELLVAVNDQHEIDAPASEPEATAAT